MLEARVRGISTLVPKFDSTYAVSAIGGELTTVVNYKERAKYSITADLGFVWAFGIGELQPYLGVNMYILNPVNRSVPLPKRIFDSPLKRTALMIGVTTGSVKEEGKRDDVLSNRTFLTGVGYRVTDAIRFTSGIMWIEKPDANPLVSRSKLGLSPFVSVSVDWDVRSTLGGIIGSVFPGVTRN